MYILDNSKFKEALKEKGFHSIGEFASALGIHRNTIHHYLSGKPVFPFNFEKMIQALDLRPSDILREKKEPKQISVLEPIVGLVDQLHAEFPNVSFILFGSRAEGRAQQYSDWDIGVYSRNGISHSSYLTMSIRTSDLAEDVPYFVELVNFNRADISFLKNVSRRWIFLAGWQQDWLLLQRRAIG